MKYLIFFLLLCGCNTLKEIQSLESCECKSGKECICVCSAECKDGICEILEIKQDCLCTGCICKE